VTIVPIAPDDAPFAGLETGAALRGRIPTIEFPLGSFEIVHRRVTADGARREPAVVRTR